MSKRDPLLHIFKVCREGDHQHCKSYFQNEPFEAYCVCACHIAFVSQGFLAGICSRQDISRMLERYKDFLE